MIVVDTSALLAVAQDEPEAVRCRACLARADAVLISAGTLAEVLLVSARRGIRQEVEEILENLPLQVEPVGAIEARRAADAHGKWGKGVHPAGLNYGDCFAYALAKARNLPLLFVGRDFSRTDIQSASVS